MARIGPSRREPPWLRRLFVVVAPHPERTNPVVERRLHAAEHDHRRLPAPTLDLALVLGGHDIRTTPRPGHDLEPILAQMPGPDVIRLYGVGCPVMIVACALFLEPAAWTANLWLN